ncbi:MAG: YlzJ-like family protein [Bacillota bacterium]
MVLYTPLWMEEVLKDHDKLTKYKEINYKGIILQVEPSADGKYRVVRIISSNLEDYLNPNIQPGVVLETRY